MATLNSIVYYDFADGFFTCHAIEIDKIGIGHSPRDAIKSLAKTLDSFLGSAKKIDRKIKRSKSSPREIVSYFGKVTKNLDKYDLLNEQINRNHCLNAYMLK